MKPLKFTEMSASENWEPNMKTREQSLEKLIVSLEDRIRKNQNKMMDDIARLKALIAKRDEK